MLVAILSFIWFVVNPIMGVITALVMPSVVAMDSDGEYSEVVIVTIAQIVLYFVYRIVNREDE